MVVPGLRGIGRSSKPEGGYDKKTQANDLRAVVTGLGYDRTFVVAHDIGNMVVYAYAALYPDKVERLVVMDAPIPGIEPWSEILQNPGGTSTSTGRMRKGWWLAGNASTSIASGTTSPAIPASPTRPRGISSRRPMRSREE